MNDKSLAVKSDQPGVDALTRCEQNITDAIRRGIEATRDIGKELLKIDKLGLYKARGCDRFHQYIESYTRFDMRTARRLQLAAQVADAIEDAKLPMPDTQSMLCELGRLKPEVRAQIWNEIVVTCEKKKMPLDFTAVKTSVEYIVEKSRLGGTAPPARRGIESSLDKPRFSEQGERALERIRRLCGEPIADALLSGTIDHVSEDALQRWSNEDDDMVRTLAYYVTEERWSVNKALAYERKLVNDETTVEQLVQLARARGGKLIIQYNDFRIQFERLRNAAA
jgi:hypothetical protein